MASNKENIFKYIQEKGQATANDLLSVLDIERSMIHRHLRALLEEGRVQKVGVAPKVWYVPVETESATTDLTDAGDLKNRIIEENFLLVTPQGDRLEGMKGFIKWCADRHYDIAKRVTEYVALYKKYAALEKNGLLDGTEKFRSTFNEDCLIDRVHYIDFYAWEIFGKTKLGQLLLYAKQSQDARMMKEIVSIANPAIERLIQKHSIDAIGYIPPTVKRATQLMDVLKKSATHMLPILGIEKVAGEVRVPQKTLSKLNDRVENARATLFVTEKRTFDAVLLVDDAVGSGATFNEVARKLKKQGVAKKVIGLAITGSLKGFDVISEV